MTLREALATALWRAGWTGQIGRAVAGDPDMSFWLPVADECLRQMEWARQRGIRFGLVCRGLRQGLVTDSPSGEEEIKAISKRDPLTFAPEDWTP